ncbi:MAG: PfkB family carbohydrate kinase, partial [Bryobacterales bacterium]|nr:PfkB family carbohydrate kinase [Bryobacterales bacterium]
RRACIGYTSAFEARATRIFKMARTTSSHVLCVGMGFLDTRLCVERFPPRQHRENASKRWDALGGPASVGAVAVVRLGGTASFWSRRGDDLAGERVEQLLSSAGVETSGYRSFPGTTPTCEVFIEPGGERYLFPYLGDGMPGDASWIPEAAIDRADAALIDGRWPEGGMRVAAGARSRGIPCVHDLDQDRAEIWEIAKLSTHVIADEDMALQCGGVEAVLRRIRSFGAWGAVTLGSRGVACEGGRVPPFPVPVQDSTGAGDVFHGAFALAMAQGRDERFALRFGCAAGALLCKLGEVPHLPEVEALLSQQPPI